MVQNKSAVFLKYPTEFPVIGEHIEVQTKELNVELKDKDVLLRNLYFSLDPCTFSTNFAFIYVSKNIERLYAHLNPPLIPSFS